MSGDFALSAAISEDRQFCSCVSARRGRSGAVVVSVMFRDDPRLALAWLDAAYVFGEPVAVVVNPKSQSGTLIEPLRNAGIVALEPSAEDVAVAHGRFLDLLKAGALEHLSQEPLTAAVRAAQQRPLSGAKAWEPRLGVDQSPLVAATLATWAFLRYEELASPGAWVI